MAGILLAALALPGQAERADPAEARLRAALKKHDVRRARIGVCVRRISDGREIFAHNHNELYEMASNTKLLTTAAALWALGADYEFRTPVLANGPIVEGVLQGDLAVVGGGDPNFSGRLYGDTMHVPREMAAAVQRAGIREITGDLLMDDRFFDRVYRAPGWPGGELLWWYAAPVSALAFNDNCTDIRVQAGAAVGRPATHSAKPLAPPMRIVNKCVTCPKGERGGVTFEKNDAGELVIGGRIPLGDARTESIAIGEPALFFAAALRTELERLGITVRGRARLAASDETAPASAREIFVWRSRLIDAVNVANRRSQNFYAEQILKTLGAVRTGKGSFESGCSIVREFARAAHLPDSTVVTVDGCGLSMGNRATPQAVAGLLEVMYRSHLQKPFMASLAVNGEAETTLRNRLREKHIVGRIRAKTGTIKSEGVSALSGYAEAHNGEIYVFSILSNDFKPDQLYLVRTLEDAICEAMVGR